MRQLLKYKSLIGFHCHIIHWILCLNKPPNHLNTTNSHTPAFTYLSYRGNLYLKQASLRDRPLLLIPPVCWVYLFSDLLVQYNRCFHQPCHLSVCSALSFSLNRNAVFSSRCFFQSLPVCLFPPRLLLSYCQFNWTLPAETHEKPSSGEDMIILLPGGLFIWTRRKEVFFWRKCWA